MSTIRIPNRPNTIIEFGPIWISTTRSYRPLQFWYNFNLISIKVDCFWSLFDKRLIKIDKKSQLKDQNCELKYWKSWFLLKRTIYIEKVDLIRSISINFWYRLTFFDIIRTRYDWFCWEDLIRFQEFGLKMWIEW